MVIKIEVEKHTWLDSVFVLEIGFEIRIDVYWIQILANFRIPVIKQIAMIMIMFRIPVFKQIAMIMRWKFHIPVSTDCGDEYLQGNYDEMFDVRSTSDCVSE